MRISLAPLASRSGRRPAAALALLLLLSGCTADAGAPTQPAEGLLVLTGGDPASLVVLAGKKGNDQPISIGLPLAAGDTASISAGAGGVIVGSTAGGDLATSDPIDPQGSAVDIAGLAWRRVEAKAEGGGPIPAPAHLATWDPTGRRFAALAGDLSGGGDITLLLVVPGDGKLSTIALKRGLLAVPPAWIDANRLALVAATAAGPAAIVVDTSNGKVTKGPAGDQLLATSADGSVIATSAGAGSPIVLRSSKGWLADDGTSVGSVDVPDGFTEAISVALDGKGERLAIVWLGADGTPRYDVHDGRDGWRRVLSQPLNGTSVASVAWLR
ncbi:MAG: hypothetical protein QOD78_18 [Chloroflexota bacterium]|nr:hypothetical protein [Chloroflexota bacterium]